MPLDGQPQYEIKRKLQLPKKPVSLTAQQLKQQIEESNQLNRLCVQNEQLRNRLRIISSSIDTMISTKLNIKNKRPELPERTDLDS